MQCAWIWQAEERFFYERHDAQVRGGRILGRLERPASACEDEMENKMKVGIDADNNSVSPRDDFSPLVTDAMPAAIRALDSEELLAVWESLHQLEPARHSQATCDALVSVFVSGHQVCSGRRVEVCHEHGIGIGCHQLGLGWRRR